MRCLFVTGGSQATVFAMAPLATAARNAGHQVLLAANEPLMDTAEAVGLPAIPVFPQPVHHYLRTDRSGRAVVVPEDTREVMLHTGRAFARMAAVGLDSLVDLADDWHPDVIVGGSMAYAAGLLAARLKVPYVRQAWDIVPMTDTDLGAEEELDPELRGLGRTGLPEPDLFVDVCPPSLRTPAHPRAARLMRWVPGNRQGRLEPWMYTRPRGRRVLVTFGTRALTLQSPAALRHLVDELAQEGAETLIAAPERIAASLRAELDDVRIGWIPLDVVAPTCDLMVHHGGGVTSMTALTAGVPQLVAPEGAYMAYVAHAVSGYGAGLTLEPEAERDAAAATAASCREILSTAVYSERARALADEVAALPAPAETVRALESLATA